MRLEFYYFLLLSIISFGVSLPTPQQGWLQRTFLSCFSHNACIEEAHSVAAVSATTNNLNAGGGPAAMINAVVDRYQNVEGMVAKASASAKSRQIPGNALPKDEAIVHDGGTIPAIHRDEDGSRSAHLAKLLEKSASAPVQRLPSLIRDSLIGLNFPFHRYQVRQVLGQGSFGRTFLVQSQETGELQALKAYPRIHSKSASSRLPRYPTSTENIVDEWVIINHQAVDLGAGDLFAADGISYLPMKYIPGPTWKSAMEINGDIPQNTKIAKKVTERMHYLHANGIVHGDAAPRNVILRNGDPNDPVLIDYGMAELRRDETLFRYDYGKFWEELDDRIVNALVADLKTDREAKVKSLGH